MYYGFGAYVSVEQQRKRALKDIGKLQKKGIVVDPVEAFGGQIAKSFWGKKWCENLETYADMEYRAERGRRYVRAGSVCHLELAPGLAQGYVSGSSLYKVRIGIAPMNGDLWEKIRAQCSADIGSLVELLQGKLSKNVMEIVSSQENGLFPKQGELSFSCSCPDGANMCKHVAAMLYGIGRRLDSRPELLFSLRGVEPGELVRVDFSAPAADAEMGNLEEIFGIDLDGGLEDGLPQLTMPESAGNIASSPALPAICPDDKPAAEPKKTVNARKYPEKKSSGKQAHPRKRKTEKKPAEINTRPFNPDKPSAESIRALRKMAKLSQAEFAKRLGVSTGAVIRWEHAESLSLQQGSILKLLLFQEKLAKRI